MASVSTTSWRDRLAKRLSSGGDREGDKAKRQGNKERQLISHSPEVLLPAHDEEWLVIEMETAFTNGTDRVDGAGISKRRSSANSRNAVSSPSSGKGSVRSPRPPLRATSPNSGPPAHHRRTSAPPTRGTSSQRLEVQNGRSSPRSSSPHRSIMVKKKSSTGSGPGQSLAVVGELPQGPEAPLDDGGGTVSPDMSNFSKVRDTLRIKGVKKKKGGAYSVPHAAPELSFDQVASKYDDPFEAPPSFMDSTEERRPGQDHSFEWVSVPHNKPEYCDHCGETAWGFHRQVMKCSSECVLKHEGHEQEGGVGEKG